ncbi:hypothetical protein Cni_G12000 [Canna indica]|uniref:Drought induced 19 protein type zinc-binding domain-containing protein n=1 Tax=Canna indica TaxID=4628 RepID=A0AAQ3K7C7_9LILI|nr:hypothetical protein Cni_G12000 [Canna indica]
MEVDSWDRLSAASKRRHLILLRAQTDVCPGFEEIEEAEDEYRPEFPCPFCSEDFDFVGLCCHLDEEHPLEVKNGAVCPICTTWVGTDMVGHITMQHGNIFKISFHHFANSFVASLSIEFWCFYCLMRDFLESSHSLLPFARKDLHDASIRSFYGGSSAAPDPLLTSFIFNMPQTDRAKDVQPIHSAEGITVDEDEISDELEDREPKIIL